MTFNSEPSIDRCLSSQTSL